MRAHNLTPVQSDLLQIDIQSCMYIHISAFFPHVFHPLPYMP